MAPAPTQEKQNLKVALKLADLNLPVFPCLAKPQGTKVAKAPHTPKGFHDATIDKEQILAWWNNWPDALVGLPTGETTGLSVLDGDINRDTGKAVGEEKILKIGLTHPKAVRIRTPSGGVHLIFSDAAGLGKTSSKKVAENES
jgi:hypothetical protein